MKYFLLLVGILSVLFGGAQSITPSGQELKSSEYIRLEFGGFSPDKPITTIVLSIEPYYLGAGTFGFARRISQCEYLLISEKISEGEIAIKKDTTELGYYKFTIVKKGVSSLYIIDNLENTKKLFSLIANQMQNDKSKKSMIGSFKNITTRLEEYEK